MAERLKEQQESFSEPAEDQLKERIERFVDNFERFTGNLNKIQIDRIYRYATQTTEVKRRWLVAKVNRQQALLGFLSRQPNREEISAFVFKVLLHGHEVADPDYQAISELRWVEFIDFLNDIMVSLTPLQCESVTKTLWAFATEMRALSG